MHSTCYLLHTTVFMLFTTHAITGAAIGTATANPVLGFIYAVLSHHLLDAIAHFDQGSLYMDKDKGPIWAGAKYEEKKKFKVKRDWIILFIDMALACALSLYILANLKTSLWPYYILGAASGLLPDIMDVSPLWKDRFRKTKIGAVYHQFHAFLHWPLSVKYWYIGLATQITIVGLALWFMQKLF